MDLNNVAGGLLLLALVSLAFAQKSLGRVWVKCSQTAVLCGTRLSVYPAVLKSCRPDPSCTRSGWLQLQQQ